MKKAKYGFTLVELLVVIGIIGILSGVLISALSGTGESALAAKCMSNLRSLATGANSIAMETGYYPFAGSCQHTVVGGTRPFYVEQPGWISWLSTSRPFANQPTKAVTGIRNATFDMDIASEEARFAITNGTMYRAVNGNSGTYVCPTLAKQRSKSRQGAPVWTYVMNAYFGYDTSNGSGSGGWGYRRKYGTLKNADRILMFAEIEPGAGSEDERDCVLNYRATIDGKEYGSEWHGQPEYIGAHHKGPKGRRFAHVVFADGHTEKIQAVGSEEDLQTLTAALCEGLDVTFGPNGYEILK